jgi:hypothetical protein
VIEELFQTTYYINLETKPNSKQDFDNLVGILEADVLTSQWITKDECLYDGTNNRAKIAITTEVENINIVKKEIRNIIKSNGYDMALDEMIKLPTHATLIWSDKDNLHASLQNQNLIINTIKPMIQTLLLENLNGESFSFQVWFSVKNRLCCSLTAPTFGKLDGKFCLRSLDYRNLGVDQITLKPFKLDQENSPEYKEFYIIDERKIEGNQAKSISIDKLEKFVRSTKDKDFKAYRSFKGNYSGYITCITKEPLESIMPALAKDLSRVVQRDKPQANPTQQIKQIKQTQNTWKPMNHNQSVTNNGQTSNLNQIVRQNSSKAQNSNQDNMQVSNSNITGNKRTNENTNDKDPKSVAKTNT